MHLGRGILTWSATERRSDRYGTVFLMEDGNTSYSRAALITQLHEEALHFVNGKLGVLTVTVIDPRKSTHIGDIFRGVFPSMQEVGDGFPLGNGVAFLEEQRGFEGYAFGVRPEDGREDSWLDVENLYKVHEHLVDLYFTERP